MFIEEYEMIICFKEMIDEQIEKLITKWVRLWTVIINLIFLHEDIRIHKHEKKYTQQIKENIQIKWKRIAYKPKHSNCCFGLFEFLLSYL